LKKRSEKRALRLQNPLLKMKNQQTRVGKTLAIAVTEDHVWFEDQWMVASLFDE
jgi:hypothetical protein